jgi:hypothetical protein
MLISGSGRRSSTEFPLCILSLRWLNNRLRSHARKYMIRDHDYFGILCLGVASQARMFKAPSRMKNRIAENNRGPSPIILKFAVTQLWMRVDISSPRNDRSLHSIGLVGNQFVSGKYRVGCVHEFSQSVGHKD